MQVAVPEGMLPEVNPLEVTGDVISAGSSTVFPLAEKMAERVLENGPLAVRAVKESVVKGLGMAIPEALEFELQQAARVFATEDAKEGPLAFLQKRKPEWKGK